MSGLSNGSTQTFVGSQFHNAAGWWNDPLSSEITQFMSTAIASGFGPINPPFLANVTQTAGTGYSALAAVATLALPTPFLVYVMISNVVQLWALVAGTSAGGAGITLPNDYNAVTNAKYWVQLQ